MDIEKLIERLRTESLYADKASLEIMDLCMDAATALSALHAENEKLRAELERCKEKNAGLALALLTECAPNPDCLGDDEWRAIRAELEKVWRGEWVGVPSMGVYDTVCSKCGYCPGIRFWSSDFCPHCGAPMTDEAVEMVMERMEEMKNG